MMRTPIPSELPRRDARQPAIRLSAPLSEPLERETARCSVFPGGVAISYGPGRRQEAAREELADADYGTALKRVYYPREPGYVIGYSAGRFGKISFVGVRSGDYNVEEPSQDEIARFRADLAQAAKKDLSVGMFLDLNPQVMG